MLFWRYCRDMKIYFRYFGYVWLRTPKMVVSTCRKLQCLGLVMKYQKTISFHFRLFLRKTNEVFQNQKTLFWSHFGPSLPKFVQKLIFLGKRAVCFTYPNYLPSSKKSEETNEPFLRKVLN